MANSRFQKGAIISATAFQGDEPFTVELISSDHVADGGTAKIFLGRTRETSTQGLSGTLALKVFVNNMADYQKQMIARELRAVRKVRHRNILQYTGVAAFEFHQILISPYMANGNLLQYFANNPRVPRLPSVIQVASAVSFLHFQHELVHGDLKCENVLVDDEGSALLADFGLSTLIEQSDTSTRTTTGLRQQISIQFAAPELLGLGVANDEERPARKTRQTDVYAFGMLVVQAYTGLPPWPGCKSTEILMRLFQRQTHPRPGNTVPPLGLCNALWSLCLVCWNYTPSSRPSMHCVSDFVQSVDTFTDALWNAKDIDWREPSYQALRWLNPDGKKNHSPESDTSSTQAVIADTEFPNRNPLSRPPTLLVCNPTAIGVPAPNPADVPANVAASVGTHLHASPAAPRADSQAPGPARPRDNKHDALSRKRKRPATEALMAPKPKRAAHIST